MDDIMDALNILSASRLSKAKRMEKIRMKFVTLSRRCPLGKVVFIVDDAQRLNMMNYEVLMSIFNELEERFDVHLFILLVGQPELKAQKDLLMTSNQVELVARMMPEDIRFTGVSSEEEVRFAFDRYQNHCFYPRGSGISYVEWFAPETVKTGWKLTDEAKGLWDAYLVARENAGLGEPHEISMHALTTMVLVILKNYASRPGFTGLKADDLKEIIDSVGFIALEKSLQDAGKVEGGDDEDEDEDEEDD